MTKAEAGRLGGKSTFSRYGSAHMREIGRKGALVFWLRYKVVPLGTSNYLLLERGTERIVRTLFSWRGAKNE